MSKASATSGTVSVERPSGAGELLILCDHASSRVPPELATLGVPQWVVESHAGWDKGALECARRLSQETDSPLVFSTVSRLVIDCNRDLYHPELIVTSTEFGPVQGNAELTVQQREERISRVHQPYHQAVSDLVRQRAKAGRLGAVISLHSFTPVLSGMPRPWHAGILYRSCEAWATALRQDMARRQDAEIGLNVPYSGLVGGVFYTLDRHAESHAIPCLMIELRNDLIEGEAGQAEWAGRIADALRHCPPCTIEADAPQQEAIR